MLGLLFLLQFNMSAVGIPCTCETLRMVRVYFVKKCGNYDTEPWPLYRDMPGNYDMVVTCHNRHMYNSWAAPEDGSSNQCTDTVEVKCPMPTGVRRDVRSIFFIIFFSWVAITWLWRRWLQGRTQGAQYTMVGVAQPRRPGEQWR